VAAQGLRNVGELIAIVRDDGDTRLPDVARQVLQVLANQIEQIETAVAALERQLLAWHKSNPVIEAVPAERQITAKQDESEDDFGATVANTVARDLDDAIPF
jgi:transposase